MKKYIIILTILASSLLGLEKIGFIADVSGYVEIISKDEKQNIEVRALEGRYIYENETIRAYDDSYCVVVFDDQAALFSIVDNSEVYLSNVDQNIKKIKLNYGQMYIENKSKLESMFVFTQSSQIHALNSSLFMRSSLNGDDAVHVISNSVDVYNKKTNISLNLNSDSKAVSTKDGDIELQKRDNNFLPEKISTSIEVNSEMLIIPIKELGRKKGDLVPDYLSNYKIDVYETEKKKKLNIELGPALSYLNNNLYSKFTINPKYKTQYFHINFELDYYTSIEDSPDINVWDDSIKILAKIKELSYSSKKGVIQIEMGRKLDQITIGHGLLVKNYTNRLNYPFSNSYGLDFQYLNSDFLNFRFFSSNLDGGFLAFHTSLFVSKYLPLKLGFGAALDMNQFVEIEDSFTLPSRDIKSFEFDSTYDLYNNKGYDIDLISEVAAVIFPDTHYYKRYNSSNDLEGALKRKNGTWGTALGVQGFYSSFFKIKALLHYNDPLFVPSFFNNTYNFERYRVLPQKETYSGNIGQIDNMFSELEYLDDLTIVPKDLYSSYINDEFVYSSSGFTFEGEYNYYDKILAYACYSTFFEVGNSLDSNTKSSLNLKIEILDKVLKNIDKIEFYYSKSLSDKILNITDTNENTCLGVSLKSKIRFNLLLKFDFERVNYDFDFDGETDNIDILEIGLTYNI